MNKSTWIFLILALAAGIALARLVIGTSDREPHELLESIRERLEASPPDYDRAFHELDLALSKVTKDTDPDLYFELLDHRSAALTRRGVFDSAMRDLQDMFELDESSRPQTLLRMGSLLASNDRPEEAIDRYDELLELVPWHRYAQERKADVLQDQAEEQFADLERLLTHSLAPREAQECLALAERIVQSHPSDPFRAADLADLYDRLEENGSKRLADARVMLPELTDAFGAAREVQVLATGNGVQGSVIEALARSFLVSGRTTLAVDLGLASLTQPNSAQSPEMLEVLATALAEQGRPDAAADVIRVALPKTDEAKLGAEFLMEWGRILFEAREWPRLRAVAGELSNTSRNHRAFRRRQAAGAFYRGIALVRLGQTRDGALILRDYARPDSFEPVPGARGQAWREVAEVERRSGRPPQEKEALRQATRLDPDGSGAAWRRLSNLQAEDDNFHGAAESLGQAIRLLPADAEVLLGEWRALGESALLERGIDIDLTLTRLNESGLVFPSENSSAFVLLRLAERLIETDEASRALELAEHLSDLMPDFLPAIDVRLWALRALDRTEERVELLVQRVELAAQNGPALAELRSLWEAEQLAPGHVFRLMQSDPEFAGRHTFARQLIDGDRPDLALLALDQSLGPNGRRQPTDAAEVEEQPSEIAPRTILLAAEAELKLGRPHLCLGRLEAIPEDWPEYPAALRLAIDAALALRNARLLETTLARFERAPTLNIPLALAIGDELVRAGLLDQALQLFEFIDLHPTAWRTQPEEPSSDSALDAVLPWEPGADSEEPIAAADLPEWRARLLLRLALVHLIQGTPEAASAALERAQAGFEDGSADFGRVLLAIQTGGWVGLPNYVADLRDSEFVPTPLEDAVLAALEDRLDEAHADLVGLEESTGDPLTTLARLAVNSLAGREVQVPESYGPQAQVATLQMLRGRPGETDARRDPRHALALIAVLERLDWRLWLESAVPDLAARAPGLMWLEYIAARSEQAAGELQAAEDRLVRLIELYPGFEPAWDLRDRLLLERLGRVDHPDRIELLALKQVAIGQAQGPTGEAAELRLARAVALEQQGKLGAALELATKTTQLYPDLLPARPVQARIAWTLGKVDLTLDAFTGFFDRAEPELASNYVPEYLALWDQLTADGHRDTNAERLEMESLALLLPEDPRIALRLSKLDIESTPTNPRLGVARAFDRLSKYRAAHKNSPLDPSSAQEWLEFYLDFDPLEAERFVRELLESRPTELELWLNLGRCFEAQNDKRRAVEWYGMIRDMVPDTRALRRIAEVLAELGSDHPQVERLIQQIRALDRDATDATRLEFLRGKSLVNSGFSNVHRGLSVLSLLWERASLSGSQLTDKELGYVYASALIRAGAYDRRELAASILQDQISASDDPLNRAGLQALSNLADALPEPSAEEDTSAGGAGEPVPGEATEATEADPASDPE